MLSMPIRRKISRLVGVVAETRYRMLAVLLAFLVAVSLATRVALLVVDRAAATDSAADIARALAVGLVMDVLASLWLLAPVALLLTLMPTRLEGRKWPRRVAYVAAAGIAFLALFTAAAAWVFFGEFNGRFNFVAVDYLIYPTEVVTNIWESYHVAWVVSGLLLLVAGVLLLLRRTFTRGFERSTRLSERVAVLGGFVAILVVLTAAVSPSTTHVSEDRALNEIASNDFYSFWQALTGVDAPYAGLYATTDPATVFARLRHLLDEPAADSTSWQSASTERHVRGLVPQRRLNVVVVLEESLGSEFIGALHPDRPSLTPSYDSLAAEGTLLTHAYSTGNRTIRALEATTSSLPPLPGIATVRRPQSENLFTLPGLLREHGYQTRFIYGGRALFDGMGRYMTHNGIDRVIEQRDFPANSFKTAWGVADEAIFDRALAEMDTLHATGKPFYTLILSVSNHRPYLYPEGRIAADPKQKRRGNVVQYADWALGRFLRQARGHAFFDSTLFVLMGDHGARVYGAEEIPLPSYEVPILFYAPGIIPVGRAGTLASSLDVPPTVLGVLGLDYESRFFGHDVFHVDSAAGRALMTHNNEIALMRGDRLAVLGLRERADLYQVDRAAGTLTPIRHPDPAGRALIADAVAYYQGADVLYRSGGYLLPPAAHGGDVVLKR
jgi:phosphoglycerol transferase MdoB-like AlkP superfamily enzyme